MLDSLKEFVKDKLLFPFSDVSMRGINVKLLENDMRDVSDALENYAVCSQI